MTLRTSEKSSKKPAKRDEKKKEKPEAKRPGSAVEARAQVDANRGNLFAGEKFNDGGEWGADLSAMRIADALAKDNPRFDAQRFLKACGVER